MQQLASVKAEGAAALQAAEEAAHEASAAAVAEAKAEAAAAARVAERNHWQQRKDVLTTSQVRYDALGTLRATEAAEAAAAANEWTTERRRLEAELNLAVLKGIAAEKSVTEARAQQQRLSASEARTAMAAGKAEQHREALQRALDERTEAEATLRTQLDRHCHIHHDGGAAPAALRLRGGASAVQRVPRRGRRGGYGSAIQRVEPQRGRRGGY